MALPGMPGSNTLAVALSATRWSFSEFSWFYLQTFETRVIVNKTRPKSTTGCGKVVD